MRRTCLAGVLLVVCCALAKGALSSPIPKGEDRLSAETFRGFTLRSIGPALTSGRVVAFAVHPQDRSHY